MQCQNSMLIRSPAASAPVASVPAASEPACSLLPAGAAVAFVSALPEPPQPAKLPAAIAAANTHASFFIISSFSSFY